MDIKLFRELFKGRDDVYGADNKCIRQSLTDMVIQGHIRGKRRIGIYPLVVDKCYFAVIDIDINDLNQAITYYNAMMEIGFHCYMESSKTKGYHLWHFFESAILAKKFRAIINHVFKQINHTYEIFPKQDYTQDVGNYINLPLFNDGKNNKTTFLNPENWKLFPDQWKFLATIKRINSRQIDTFIKDNKLSIEKPIRKANHDNATLSSIDIDLMVREFVSRAISKASTEGRNNAGLDLASQLRDHDISQIEAESIIERYQSQVSDMKDHAYTREEAIASLKSAYSQPKRESWWKPKPSPVPEPKKESISIPEEEHNEDIDDVLPFPSIENKLCNQYMQILEDVTEAPRSYHLFTFLTIVGMLVGRSAYISWGADKIFPNLWTMIVGHTGRARKSSTINKGRAILNDIAPDVQVLSSLSTWEGLLSAMQRSNDNIVLRNEVTIVCMSEFDGFLKKTRQDSIAHLIPQLCDLYDCQADVRSVTKGNPLVVKNPFFSILAGIQPEVLEKSFQSNDVHGGFAGRFIYVYDVSDKEIPIPIWNKQKEYNALLMELNAIKITNTKERAYAISDDCIEIWNLFYHTYRTPNGDPPLLLQLNDRMQNHVLKIAMLFAILDESDNIDKKHLVDAVSIGYWLMYNNRKLFGMLGISEQQRIEQKIIDLIGVGVCNRREIFQSLSGRITGRDFDYAITGLIKADVIYEQLMKNQRGRPTKILKLNA